MFQQSNEVRQRLEWELDASDAPAFFCVFYEDADDVATIVDSCRNAGNQVKQIEPNEIDWFDTLSREREVATWPGFVVLPRCLSTIPYSNQEVFNRGRDYLRDLNKKLVFVEPIDEEGRLRRIFPDIFSCMRDTFRLHQPIYDDDYLFDSNGHQRRETIVASLPAAYTRGSTIIKGGRPLFKSQPKIMCPRCQRELKPGTTKITFQFAPESRREQTVNGWVCQCGEAYVPGTIASKAHRLAYGFLSPGDTTNAMSGPSPGGEN